MVRFISILIFMSAFCACTNKENGPQTSTDRFDVNLSSAMVNKDNLAFAKNDLPRIIAACPGLRKYKDDWQLETITNNGFTILVADKPQHSELINYRAMHNRCFFDLLEDRKSVSIPKRACASLCEDVLSDERNLILSLS